MKISADTLSLLKSFAGINQSIYVEVGNELKTISNQKTIIATATVEEQFDQSFGVYDLNQFLSTVSLFDKPEFEFHENHMVISDESSRVKYGYVAKDLLVTPPDKKLELPNVGIQFKLTNKEFQASMNAANVLGLPNWCVVVEGGKIFIRVCNKNDPSSNDYTVGLGDADVADNEYVFRTENLRLIPYDYNVEVSDLGISHFVSDNEKVEYFIATETR